MPPSVLKTYAVFLNSDRLVFNTIHTVAMNDKTSQAFAVDQDGVPPYHLAKMG
jgi:hypothetical protein